MLRLLRVQWEKGDAIEVISNLLVIFDESFEEGGSERSLVTLSDFLASVDLKGGGLNLDACTKLLPLFENMLNECMHLPHIVFAAVNSVLMLCEAFGELIRQTRSIVVTGVDLSREERLKKCNACHTSLFRIRKRLETVIRQYNPASRGHESNVEGPGNKKSIGLGIVTAARKLTALILDI
jgi:hypothetical protein